MHPQIASPNVYRQQSEWITNSHKNSTNRWQGFLFFSVFFGANFRNVASKAFGNGELERCTMSCCKILGCQRRIEVENFTCSITLPMQLARALTIDKLFATIDKLFVEHFFALKGAQ